LNYYCKGKRGSKGGRIRPSGRKKRSFKLKKQDEGRSFVSFIKRREAEAGGRRCEKASFNEAGGLTGFVTPRGSSVRNEAKK